MLTQFRNTAGPRSQTRSTAPVVLLTAMVCALLLSAGCAGQSVVTSVNPPPAAPPPPSATVSFCDNPSPGCTPASSFSTKSLPALSVIVAWSNVPPGTHAQALRFFLPDGYVYQAIETSFVVAQQPVGSASAVASLPVAGSFITKRGLTGNWKVEVSLDGNVVGSKALQFNP
jgi:hypothetical protein